MLQKTERQHTAHCIELTDVLTKIMDVQIGRDNTIHIKKDILDEIFLSLKQYNYETGGIIGVNERGVIAAFQFDKTHSYNPFEYCPNVDFLNQVINDIWTKENVEFVGFVHSHLHNAQVSRQDILYSRKILKANTFLDDILVGILDLSKQTVIKWYVVSIEGIVEVLHKKTE